MYEENMLGWQQCRSHLFVAYAPHNVARSPNGESYNARLTAKSCSLPHNDFVLTFLQL